MNKPHMSSILAALALIIFSFSTPAQAQNGPRAEGLDMVMGDPNAPVTIIEYASLTCSYCAKFHTEVLAPLKAAYVDTGKVRFVFRDFPLDRIALNAAMLARCNGAERYFAFLDAFFGQQSTWLRGGADQTMSALRRLARTGGMSESAMDACLADTEIQNAVLSQAMTGEREHKVAATPTLVINGQVQRGAPSFEELENLIKPLIK